MSKSIERQNRKLKAKINTEKYNNEYTELIQDSIRKSKIYRDGTKFRDLLPKKEKEQKNSVLFDFTCSTTDEAIFNVLSIDANKNKKIAALNFGNYKNAGGHFLEGGKSQEEELCQHSYLYNVLSAFNKEYYVVNQRKPNRCIYADTALYTPDINFFLLEENQPPRTNVDIITCSPPNFNGSEFARIRHNLKNKLRWSYLSFSTRNKIIRNRLTFIKNICELNNIEILIAGAWGCGSYEVDRSTVSYEFTWVFHNSTTLKKVIFAVPNTNIYNKASFENMVLKYNKDEYIETWEREEKDEIN